ncbi:RelA/SpoT domain-containing protein [Phyllobacterium sp. 22552]|uniref:RelA/SpoT domain-containing protein n=1 Tax=Phyllobacterium sp. 22552 TaxID=3453941 RepID=UPI003F86F950
MAEFVSPRYTKSDVAHAGKLLLKGFPATDEGYRDAVEAFRIAYNWRNAHFLPLYRIRHELSGKARGYRLNAITASRMKRMQSIRKKLSTTTLRLNQIQDLGGCRAILANMDELKSLVAFYQHGGSAHTFSRQKDYIEAPKEGGYRSHHIILQFQGGEEYPAHSNLQIEMQIRTELQHSWATAVEAVGLYRNEDLKGGQGNPDWLRLFELMSSELALSEECAIVPGTSPDSKVRKEELIELERRIGAIKTLESFKQAIHYSNYYEKSSFKFFLIQYDNANHEVTVAPYRKFEASASQYALEERNNGSRNTVLVEIDRVENLKKAYPNYFLDVGKFVYHLKKAIFPSHLAWTVQHP